MLDPQHTYDWLARMPLHKPNRFEITRDVLWQGRDRVPGEDVCDRHTRVVASRRVHEGTALRHVRIRVRIRGDQRTHCCPGTRGPRLPAERTCPGESHTCSRLLVRQAMPHM